MTKKHFVEAAKMISRIRDKRERKRSAVRFATLFRKFGKRFDSERFFIACKVK